MLPIIHPHKLLLAVTVLCSLCFQPVFAAPTYGYVIKHTYPHDTGDFTEGLLIKDGYLYESTGLNDQSFIYKKELKTGKVLMKAKVPAEYFGEGIAIIGNELFALTWQSKVGFVYDLNSFKVKRKFSYPFEGWGMTSDGTSLYTSDGSNVIRTFDPKTMEVVRSINVTLDGHAITRLNELEWIDGEIYSNVWGSNFIVRINPLSGQVVGVIDLNGVINLPMRAVDDVLNGIAYDNKLKKLYVTGKHWPSIFEIELIERKQ